MGKNSDLVSYGFKWWLSRITPYPRHLLLHPFLGRVFWVRGLLSRPRFGQALQGKAQGQGRRRLTLSDPSRKPAAWNPPSDTWESVWIQAWKGSDRRCLARLGAVMPGLIPTWLRYSMEEGHHCLRGPGRTLHGEKCQECWDNFQTSSSCQPPNRGTTVNLLSLAPEINAVFVTKNIINRKAELKM